MVPPQPPTAANGTPPPPAQFQQAPQAPPPHSGRGNPADYDWPTSSEQGQQAAPQQPAQPQPGQQQPQPHGTAHHSQRMVKMARELGIDEQLIRGFRPEELEEEVYYQTRQLADSRRLRQPEQFQQQFQQPAQQLPVQAVGAPPAQAAQQGSRQAEQAPALDPAFYNADLINAFKHVYQQLARLDAVEASIQQLHQGVQQQRAMSDVDQIDQWFLSRNDHRYGGAIAGRAMHNRSDEFRRRQALIALSQQFKEGSWSDRLSQAEAAIYGQQQVQQQPYQQAAIAPAYQPQAGQTQWQPTANQEQQYQQPAPVVQVQQPQQGRGSNWQQQQRRPDGTFATFGTQPAPHQQPTGMVLMPGQQQQFEQQWQQGGLMPPTQRHSPGPPAGDEKAVQTVARMLKENGLWSHQEYGADSFPG